MDIKIAHEMFHKHVANLTCFAVFLFIFVLINLSWYNHGNAVLDDGIANNP